VIKEHVRSARYRRFDVDAAGWIPSHVVFS